jgi:hypothetical protein
MTDKNDELIRRGDALAEVEITSHPNKTSYAPHLYDRIAALPAVLPVVTVKPLVWVDAPDGPDEWVTWCNVAQDYHGAGSLSQRAQVESDRAARILAELVVQPAPDAAPRSPTPIDARPAPVDPKVAALVKFVRGMALRAISSEHNEDEKFLIAHDELIFQRDCDITEARAALAALEGRGNE